MKSAWGAMMSTVAVLVSLAACSDSGDSASSSTVTIPSSITSPASSSTSTIPASTAAALNTTTATSDPQVPTSVSPDVQVKDAYVGLYDAYWVCLRSPTTCEPTTLTASIGPARAALTKTVTDLVTGGLFVGPDDPGYVVVESVKLSGPTTATVNSCWWDTGVLYGPPAAAGGDPVIVNNLQVTSRFQTTMELEGGKWLTSEETRTERTEGENRCPPEA